MSALIHHGGRFSVEDAIEPIVCECKPCEKCSGEGSWVNYCDYRTGELGYTRCIDCHGHPAKCERCHGTGKDSDDCSVHADLYGNPLPNGVCCERFRVSNIRHDDACHNFQSGEDEFERARR